jgi:transcriptional regulator with XRE-family HTH domain
MEDNHGFRQNGYAIRTIRQIQGISLEELADRTDSHPQSLRNIEIERKQASVELLNLIARALGIDTAAIQRTRPGRGVTGPAAIADDEEPEAELGLERKAS